MMTMDELTGGVANFVAGEWLADGEGELVVTEPYGGAELARVPLATAAQMERALASARAACGECRGWSAGKRAAHLERLRDLIAEHRETLAELIVREAGKPISQARGELARCITTVGLAATEATRFAGEVVPLDVAAGEGKTAYTARVPIGVVGCITPFNFPLNLVLHKVAPALAVGCPVIVKPAPQAPLCTLALARLIEAAGYPAGVFHALVCEVPVAELLVRDPRVAMLSFTGSDTVGWHLKSIAGRKKVVLELGGNGAVIVDASADLATTAQLVAQSAYAYAGQVCISTQRIYVVAEVYDAFEALLIQEVAAITCGDPRDESVHCGPIIDAGHLERVTAWVDAAVAGGARLLAGGQVLDADRHVYAPTLLTDTSPEMKVCCAEVFGPVAIVERVATFTDAIARVNDSDYGLQAGVFTDSLAHVRQAHAELEVGGVMINMPPAFRIDSMPYGGVKTSGFGREGIRYAMTDMTEPRLLVY